MSDPENTWLVPSLEEHRIRVSEPGVKGLDELASRLNVTSGIAADEWGIEGKSGKQYSLMALLNAFLDLMDARR